MRKGVAEGRSTVHFDKKTLEKLETKGYKYVQVKGLTNDKHYEYIDPHLLVLVPMKELPTDPSKKDIYEPIESKMLQQWASENDEHFQIVIATTNKLV